MEVPNPKLKLKIADLSEMEKFYRNFEQLLRIEGTYEAMH